MPQQQRAIDTRRNTLRGAAVVIERRGYEAATIAEIVAESGVTKGALYFHFPSKEAIAEAIIAEQRAWLTEREDLEGAPVQAIIDISYGFVEAILDDPLMRASIRMTTDRAAAPETIAAGYEGWITVIEGLLGQADRAGTLLPHVRPAGAAYIMTSTVTGLQMTSDALTSRTDLVERVEEFWRLFVPAFVRPELVEQVDVRPPKHRPRTVMPRV